MNLTPEQVKQERERFATWANGKGYDIAYTYDTERSRWVFFNPMTADLWVCWQDCAALVAAQEREQCARLVDDIEAKCVADDVDSPELPDVASAIRARKEET